MAIAVGGSPLAVGGQGVGNPPASSMPAPFSKRGTLERVKRWAVCVNGEVQFTTAPSAEAAKAYINARMLKLFGRANITDVQLINDNK